MNRQEVVSQSLIVTSSKPGVPKEHYKKFCLGLPDWCPCCAGDESAGDGSAGDRSAGEKVNMTENNPNAGGSKQSERGSKFLQLKRSRTVPKHVAQSGQKKVKDNDDRFSFDVTMEELDAFKEGDCPANTVKSTDWAVRTFESWRTVRNKKHPTDLCPSELSRPKIIKRFVIGSANLLSKLVNRTERNTLHEVCILCCQHCRSTQEKPVL